ncbi:DUF4136 domain-containing protein [Chryseosolibacter indicus]|uniref:DUF4136 domain-containing protein n=1 Tax=Chryseosolibacter indicus TaxID=2782351 RepID=A0ABS5VYF3_9BACT|nr:DUF4136 domain-containing protein [Chryseosolibacter indicus]MBT1706438.1 DUF4136 domain-containing protein [Chryseosolibacter indicus]
MKRKVRFFFVVLAGLIASCQSEPDTKTLLDQLVVSTNYDTIARFNSYVTFAIPTDTIGLISNNSQDTIITANRSDFPRPVLDAIGKNLSDRGYTKVGRKENPDLGVNVVVVNDFNVFQQIVYPDPYFYPGGGFYPGYYGGYYGYNSWYYYPYVNTYAYNTGVLVIELVDLKNRNANNQVRVVWTAYLGDIYSTVSLINQAVSGIDQAFQQSNYIGTGL